MEIAQLVLLLRRLLVTYILSVFIKNLSLLKKSPFYIISLIYRRHLYGVVALLVVVIFLSACENDLKKVAELSAQVDTNLEVTHQVELVYSDQGKVRVKIEAPLVHSYKQPDIRQEFPKGVKVTFFNDSLKVISVLTSKYAVRYVQKQQTIVRDSVQVKSMLKNETLQTEEMLWDERKHQITSDKFVTVLTETQQIFAQKGFESNENFTDYKLKGVQNSRFKVNKNEF